MKTKFTLLISAMIILFVGCKKSETPITAQTDTTIIPTTHNQDARLIGNWYLDSMITPTGGIYDTTAVGLFYIAPFTDMLSFTTDEIKMYYREGGNYYQVPASFKTIWENKTADSLNAYLANYSNPYYSAKMNFQNLTHVSFAVIASTDTVNYFYHKN